MSPMSRRRVLVAGGTALGSLIAGCTGGSSIPTYQGRGPTPGGGEVLTVEKTITDESYEYVESSDIVRTVTDWRAPIDEVTGNESGATRIPEYRRIPFEDWASSECAYVGSSAVTEHLESHFGGDLPGVSTGVATEDGESTIVVSLETILDREGTEVLTPSVGFEEVREATPARVNVTITFQGRSYSTTVPVVVEEYTAQYA